MAMRFLRVIFVCAVILCFSPAKSLAQLANIGHPGIRNITLSFHVKDPEDVVVPPNDTAVLKCPVRSPSSVDATSARGATTVQWLHWDLPLPADDNRWTVHRDGSLYVPHVTSTGRKPVTGPYRCLVKNELGVIVTEEAQLQIASLELDEARENIEVAEQQPVFLPCKAQSVPKANVKWDFNGQTLPQDLSYVPLPSGALLILTTLRSHAGIYRCTVTNSVLGISKNKTVNLTVLDPLREEQQVSIIPISLNSTATMGMNTSLYCVATGWPLPKIEWRNNDKDVVGNSSILELSANRTSTGAYECRAYNGETEAKQIFHLTVQQRPYFITQPKSYSYTSPSNVKLDCRAGGFPSPCIKWLKNGKPIRLNERIRKDRAGSLVLSHSFTHDKGIYQCVATNSAGSARSLSHLVLTSSTPPPPPMEVQCRSHDEHSICVTWKNPPNVRADAFSIYVYFNNSKKCNGNCQSTSDLSGCDEVPQEQFGPEYVVISGSSYLADRLNASTNYTFYIRLYSRAASDESNKVSCITAVKGERNLKFKWVNATTLELVWSNVSSDLPCGSSNATYLVQWKRNNHPQVNTSTTGTLKYNISGLVPSLVYHFRVMSSSYRTYDAKWTALKMPDATPPPDEAYITPQGEVEQEAPPDPNGFRVTRISAKWVILSWLPQPSDYAKSYIICYSELSGGIFNAFTLKYENAQASNQKCLEANAVVSLNNIMQVDHLKPNTLYEFKIQSVNSDGVKLSFASPVTIQTHPDVPSTVLDIKYDIINESTACLTWLPPAYINGILNNYTVTYTSNPNRRIEEWTVVSVPASKGSNLSCTLDEGRLSILLVNLKKTEEYTIIVRAHSSIGMGFPNVPLVLKFSNKKRETDAVVEYQEYMTEKQKMGVIGGCILALACIACCVSCIAYRRRCVKQRDRAHHARLAAAGTYRPAVARYASQGASSHVRLEAPCPVTHETQNLVTEEEDSSEVPSSMPPVHLDTKGRNDYPNDHINGLKKPSMNGHLLNGHVHITENPQFDRKEKNGDIRNNSKKSPQYTLFHDDPNSNRIQSPVHKHRYVLDPPSPDKRHRCSPIYTNGTGLYNGHLDVDDDAFPYHDREEVEKAHARYAEDPFVVANHRRISPMVVPNG